MHELPHKLTNDLRQEIGRLKKIFKKIPEMHGFDVSTQPATRKTNLDI